MKKSLAVALFVWSAAPGPVPGSTLSAPPATSSHRLTIVVCDEGPGDVCTNLKKVRDATVIIDDRHAGRTNEHGCLTTTVRPGQRTVNIAATGYAAAEIRIDVAQDTQRDVELTPTLPPGP